MSEKALRDHLHKLLDGGSAHLTFDDAVAGLPPALRGADLTRLATETKPAK